MRSVDLRTAGAGASVGLAAFAAAAIASYRGLRARIARDPESETLRNPAEGSPTGAVSADGTKIHVEAFGPPSGPAVLLMHGWTETIAYWTYVVRELERHGIRSVVPDLRGHGQSARAAGGDYSLARFGEDVEAVLATCVPAGQRAVVAGHSLGAMSIAAWAENHDVRARASAAALMNTGVGELVAESLLLPVPAIARAVNRKIAVRGFLGARAPLPRFSTPVSHAVIRYVAFGPAATPAQVAFYERMLVSCPPDVRAEVGVAMSEMDLYHALANLTIPTAVIAGARDRLTPPSHARRIAEMLPQLHGLTVLEGVGHMSPLERPQEITATLQALVSLAGRAPAVAA